MKRILYCVVLALLGPQPLPTLRKPTTGRNGADPIGMPSPGKPAYCKNGRNPAHRLPGESTASAAATALRPSPTGEFLV